MEITQKDVKSLQELQHLTRKLFCDNVYLRTASICCHLLLFIL